MLDFIPGIAIMGVIAACIRSILMRPPLIECNEIDIADYIKENQWATTTTVYYYDPKRNETFYDAYKRISVKDNHN